MNSHRMKITCWGAVALILLAGLSVKPALALEDNLHFSGTLTSAPCGLDPLMIRHEINTGFPVR